MFLRLAVLLTLIAPRAAITQSIPNLIFQPDAVPFPSSHASTLVELKDGKLMAAWFGGTAEGDPDVAIWAARGSGSVWSKPEKLASAPSVPCWNPVLFHTTDGRLWLYYKAGASPATWTAARKFSRDEGITWSPTEYLPAGLIGPVRAKPLILRDGTIVSGSSTESYKSWAVWIERSTDQGQTWSRIGPILPSPPQTFDGQHTTGIIQPSVVSLGAHHLRLYARSTELLARIVAADSLDDGLTWTQAHPLDLPNPNSGIDAVALRDGRVVLIFNNTPTGRTPLNLAVSQDGEHFTPFATLEDQPGEYSYPALIQTSTGDLELTYTWNRKSIKHLQIPLAQVPR